MYTYTVCTVSLAGKSPNIRSIIYICRVGQNCICTVHTWYFWQGNPEQWWEMVINGIFELTVVYGSGQPYIMILAPLFVPALLVYLLCTDCSLFVYSIQIVPFLYTLYKLFCRPLCAGRCGRRRLSAWWGRRGEEFFHLTYLWTQRWNMNFDLICKRRGEEFFSILTWSVNAEVKHEFWLAL